MILIVLDRDGTLIQEVNFLGKTLDWKKKIVFKEKVLFLINALDKIFPKNFKIVLTNQSGVARGYFSEKRVKEINKYLDNKLRTRYNIKINSWKYSPYVDKIYAEKTNHIFNKKYIVENTKRKPSTDLVIEALEENNLSLTQFSRVIVLGDREEDRLLAENLKAVFIDTN